ncbi:hypothetical protein Acr_23g0020500 [Actinidia rufa]|uniref:Uncharacterized protein n=1 Tax=Actinidia rufa TaxID=165716 RepID=A0A7J0GS58_9ERIC|nr:hypothetical protein Acr_23g0020500 [Actinidia rufa]
MGLAVYWYDFVCFGIVGIAFLGALYVIWRREGAGKCDDTTMYESLVVTRPDMDGYYAASGVTPIGHVSSTQLWTSCWLGLHPIWLFGLRFASFLITSGFLAWDILEYGSSIFVYYTEWTFTLVIVYFAIGTIVSAHGCMVYYSKKLPASENGQKEELLRRDVESTLAIGVKEIRGTIKLQSHYDREAIQQRAGFWGYLMQTAYQTCAGAVILTDLVFWCIIVPFLSNAHLELNMLMGCMHTLNAVFLLLDASVNNLVAISIPRAFITMGTFVVLVLGCGSHPRLWVPTVPNLPPPLGMKSPLILWVAASRVRDRVLALTHVASLIKLRLAFLEEMVQGLNS